MMHDLSLFYLLLTVLLGAAGLPEQHCCVSGPLGDRGQHRHWHSVCDRIAQWEGDLHLPGPPSLCEQSGGAEVHLHSDMRGRCSPEGVTGLNRQREGEGETGRLFLSSCLFSSLFFPGVSLYDECRKWITTLTGLHSTTLDCTVTSSADRYYFILSSPAMSCRLTLLSYPLMSRPIPSHPIPSPRC